MRQRRERLLAMDSAALHSELRRQEVPALCPRLEPCWCAGVVDACLGGTSCLAGHELTGCLCMSGSALHGCATAVAVHRGACTEVLCDLSFQPSQPPRAGLDGAAPCLTPHAAGDAFLAVTGSARIKVYDRDGRERGESLQGDMYIRDLRNTKGHVSPCTNGAWHPLDRLVSSLGVAHVAQAGPARAASAPAQTGRGSSWRGQQAGMMRLEGSTHGAGRFWQDHTIPSTNRAWPFWEGQHVEQQACTTVRAKAAPAH